MTGRDSPLFVASTSAEQKAKSLRIARSGKNNGVGANISATTERYPKINHSSFATLPSATKRLHNVTVSTLMVTAKRPKGGN